MYRNINSPVDLELLKSLESLVMDEFPMVINRFLQDAERHLQRMEDAYLELSFDSLFEAAHSFKGSSGTLAAYQLSQLCFELEQLASGKEPNLSRTASLLNAIQDEYQRVKAALLQYRDASIATSSSA